MNFFLCLYIYLLVYCIGIIFSLWENLNTVTFAVKNWFKLEIEIGFRNPFKDPCGFVLVPFSWDNYDRKIEYSGGLIFLTMTFGYTFHYFKSKHRKYIKQHEDNDRRYNEQINLSDSGPLM